MFIDIHLLGASVLILVFAILLVISQSRRTREGTKSGRTRACKQERRAHPRYETSLRIKYKTQLEEGISWIKDISKSGARIFLNNTLKSLGVGEPLEIEIDLPYELQPISVKGNIVWAKENDAGFHFIEVIQDDIERLMRHVSPDTTD